MKQGYPVSPPGWDQLFFHLKKDFFLKHKLSTISWRQGVRKNSVLQAENEKIRNCTFQKNSWGKRELLWGLEKHAATLLAQKRQKQYWKKVFPHRIWGRGFTKNIKKHSRPRPLTRHRKQNKMNALHEAQHHSTSFLIEFGWNTGTNCERYQCINAWVKFHVDFSLKFLMTIHYIYCLLTYNMSCRYVYVQKFFTQASTDITIGKDILTITVPRKKEKVSFHHVHRNQSRNRSAKRITSSTYVVRNV